MTWATLDPTRRDLCQFLPGPEDSDRGFDMGQLGAKLLRSLLKLVNLASQFGAIVVKLFQRVCRHAARTRCQYPRNSALGLLRIASVTIRSTCVPFGTRL